MMIKAALFRVSVPMVTLVCVGSVALAQSSAPPSAFCHVTDGQFTACSDGGSEWSDVPVQSFPQTQSFIYASQADLDPTAGSPFSPLDTFILMYDECANTAPLGPNDYFRVAFKTVEVDEGVEKLEHYVLHLFADGTIVFVEDGVVQPPGRAPIVDGMRGAVGFGPSPSCPVDHVIAEFQVPLSITGSSYSPDPLFWGASIPEVGPSPLPPLCGEGHEVPVLVNVLTGVVNFDDAAIEDMVSRANQILVQGGMCLTLAHIDRDTRDLGNNDGIVNQETEYPALIDACWGELTSLFGRGLFGGAIGYKVTIVKDFLFADLAKKAVGMANRGVLFLKNDPCVFVSADPVLNPDRGQTLAHEIGHTAGLGHVDDPDNLMHPSELSAGGLTEVQQALIVAATLDQRSNTEHAAWTDAIGDVGPAYVDLRGGSLFAPSQAAGLEIAMRLAGLFPAGGAVNVKVEVLFDSDSTQATGATVGSRRGIDKILEIFLTGRFPFTDAQGTMTATLLDVASATSSPLAPGVVGRVQRIVDFVDVAEDFNDVVHQTVPFPLLGISAPQVPIAIRTTDVQTGEVDEASFVFTLSETPGPPGLRAIRPGFDASTLPRGFNGSSGLVPLGFSVNFFGRSFSGLFVNNHGNLTLDAPLENFVLVPLKDVSRAIIAPFYADVDTRVGGVVTYGAGTVGNRPAFGATWPGVRCFGGNPALNFFQVVLIDRSDVGSGDFDIELNYDQIQWDKAQFPAGDQDCFGFFAARAGFSNGTEEPGTFFELLGSGIPGVFLDTNSKTGLIHGGLNADQAGRYLLRVRNGVPSDPGDRDGDDVADDLDNCPRTANTDQRDSNLNGIGDACETPGLLNTTSAFMQAEFDGSTFVEPRSLLVAEEPSLLEQLTGIVSFRVDAGLTNSANATTTNLVNSLVAVNIVHPAEAGALVDAVIGQVTQPLRGDIDRDGDVDRSDIDVLLQHRNRLVGDSTCGLTCDLDNDGTITVLDARIVVTLCTRPRCAAQ